MSGRPPSDARWRPVLALAIVALSTGVLAKVTPEEGWQVGGLTWRWSLPSPWQAWIEPEETAPIVPRWKPEDVEDLLARYDAELSQAEARLDSTAATQPVAVEDTAAVPGPDSVATRPPRTAPVSAPSPAAAPSPASSWVPGALRIRLPESNPDLLHPLWSRLQQREDVCILHYGDSQIEGDRISGTLRGRWQERWGGFGPGIQPPIPLVQSFALRQSSQGPWQRHTRFGRRDSTDRDENYGLLASYADAPEAGAPPLCLTWGREARSPASFGMWTGLELWHDSVFTECIISLGEQAVDTLRAGTLPGVLALPGSSMMPGDPELELCFSAAPPRLFAVHPEGAGVQWHSVAMRGSSGTLFRKLARRPFAQQLDRLDPDLVVLQFGGNSVPYCQDSTSARRYAGWLKRQIQLFQSLQPEAAILVIGPSDMAEKAGLNWTSYPMLSPIRDALLEATLDAGAAYWDLLEVMGGLGSMPAWVAATPALAGPDHVHFTPRGARKVGELLDRALWAEFRQWEQGTSDAPLQGLQPRSAQPLNLQTGVQHAP